MPITITCQQCGREVTRDKGDEGRGKFCSIACGRAAQRSPSKEARFWAKVQKTDGCWIWTGQRKSGQFPYGLLGTGPRGAVVNEAAHRLSYELHFGPIPAGMQVCHRCDNPPCVRPDHLFLGTQGDNNRDRDQKGRQRTYRKLTPYLVSEIRRRRAAGEKFRVLAADYNTSTGHIANIVARRWWKHIP